MADAPVDSTARANIVDRMEKTMFATIMLVVLCLAAPMAKPPDRKNCGNDCSRTLTSF
jgi:hypothetical protein